MKFSLIVCTYKRPKALTSLLDSVVNQELYPNEILIIDGSTDNDTLDLGLEDKYEQLKYFMVPPEHRGLTKQRNYGIERVASEMDIVCFLDDDIILEPVYFKELIGTYIEKPDAIGVGGYITNEVTWRAVPDNYKPKSSEFVIDGFSRSEPFRMRLRKSLGLLDKTPPCYMPKFSHGRYIGHLPPSGKIYDVEAFMGGVSSFTLKALQTVSFSEYFEGYGLYEDLEFCLRVNQLGPLYVNTAARLGHYHEASGRPNQYVYGRMVLRNGWYVWRRRFDKPNLKNRIKWNLTALLLAILLLLGIFKAKNKMQVLTEFLGRVSGWFSLIFNKPRLSV